MLKLVVKETRRGKFATSHAHPITAVKFSHCFDQLVTACEGAVSLNSHTLPTHIHNRPLPTHCSLLTHPHNGPLHTQVVKAWDVFTGAKVFEFSCDQEEDGGISALDVDQAGKR